MAEREIDANPKYRKPDGDTDYLVLSNDLGFRSPSVCFAVPYADGLCRSHSRLVSEGVIPKALDPAREEKGLPE